MWVDIWRTFLADLDEAGWLDWEEAFVDATFMPARKRTDAGKTKRGKGTKCMAVADGQGIPLGICTASASPAEITLLEPTLVATVVTPHDGRKRLLAPQRLIADKAYDSDAHRERLAHRGIELICPHRSNRTRPATQDGRPLRHYRKATEYRTHLCVVWKLQKVGRSLGTEYQDT